MYNLHLASQEFVTFILMSNCTLDFIPHTVLLVFAQIFLAAQSIKISTADGSSSLPIH